jgi:hypothetical protein
VAINELFSQQQDQETLFEYWKNKKVRKLRQDDDGIF